MLAYKNGLDDRIRTCDLLRPRQPPYQTELHPDGDGGTSGERSHDRRIKSPLLYLLSYRSSKSSR